MSQVKDYKKYHFAVLPQPGTRAGHATYTLDTLHEFKFAYDFHSNTQIGMYEPIKSQDNGVKLKMVETINLESFTNFILIYHETYFYNWIKHNPAFVQFLWNIKDVQKMLEANVLTFAYMNERFQTSRIAADVVSRHGVMFNFIKPDLVKSNPELKIIALSTITEQNPRTHRTIVIGI